MAMEAASPDVQVDDAGPPAALSSGAEFRRAWTVLLAGTVGTGLGTTGLPFYSFGLFVRPMGQEFGWSRGSISGGITCLMVGTVLTSPFVGRVIDKVGVRIVAILSQIGLALGFVAVSLVGSQLSGFYAAWLALSFLGSGTSPIVWTRAVASWFDRSRGLALGIMLCGTGIVALCGPVLINEAISTFGWQGAYRILAITLLVVGLPLTSLFLRSNPNAVSSSGSSGGVTLRDALRMSAFWRIEIAFIIISVVVGGLIVHLPAMLIDRGASPASAAAVAGRLGYAIIIGRLSLGMLVDRMPPAIVGATLIGLLAISSILLALNMTPLIAVILLGLSAGAEVDLLAFLISRIFGLRHYAQIYGCGISAFTMGGAIGPVLAGHAHDVSGSYVSALYIFAGMTVVASALLVSLHPLIPTARH